MNEMIVGDGPQHIYTWFAIVLTVGCVLFALLMFSRQKNTNLLSTINTLQDRMRSLREKNDKAEALSERLEADILEANETIEKYKQEFALSNRAQRLMMTEAWVELVRLTPGPNACVELREIAEHFKRAIAKARLNQKTLNDIVANQSLPDEQKIHQIYLCLRNFPLDQLTSVDERIDRMFANEASVKETIEFTIKHLNEAIPAIFARLQISDELIESINTPTTEEELLGLLARD